MKKIIYTIIFASLSFSSYAESVRSVEYNGEPIKICSAINNDKLIKFGFPVSITNFNTGWEVDMGVPITNQGNIIFHPNKAFTGRLLKIENLTNQKTYLIYLSADKSCDNQTINFIVPTSTTSKSNISSNNVKNVSPITIYTELMRFGVQSLYAPPRLIKNPLNATLYKNFKKESIDGLIEGQKVASMPLVEWNYQGKVYLTAIELMAIWDNDTTINTSDIVENQHFIAMSMYPSDTVNTKSRDTNSTTLFIISSVPFDDIINQIKNGEIN